MSDSVDRVFGHALNTVNRIRPGSQKPPAADRLILYGLYKQSMEGNVSDIADRPTLKSNVSAESVRREQEKWDAWKANQGLSRTEAKRRYIEKLIDAMNRYASTAPEARELVEELEFVWDQIKNNSQHSSSEHSSPLQHLDRRDYLHGDPSRAITSSSAALENATRDREKGRLQMMPPVSQVDDDDEPPGGGGDDEREEFVDAPISQYDDEADAATTPADNDSPSDPFASSSRPSGGGGGRAPGDPRWRKRIESSLIRLTTEVAALREQLEARKFISERFRRSFWGWALRISWWVASLAVADAVLLWVVILYMRRREDNRLEGAIRVLLGDAVAQVQNLKMPALPRRPAKRHRG